jgi:REP element-mobilizing transposase RayT
MTRPLRLEFPNALYHVTSRGDRREDIFEDEQDRERFLEIFGTVVTNYNWLCHGYCLMSNHYHLIIETLDGNLSKGMRQLNGVYTQASNRRHRRCGHLFQGRYKAILVDKENYLLELARYVVLNPVRAKGMVDRIGDWPWSSYLAMIGGAPQPDWLTTDWLLSQFGAQKKRSMEKYRQFVVDGIQNKRDIWSDLQGQIYLGDEAFISRMQRKTGKEKDDLNIPQKQKRPVAPPLAEIVQKPKERDAAIITADATGAYSQREIGEYFQFHPSTVGVIVRRSNNS